VAVGGGEIITHAFRLGNLVVVVSLFAARNPPSRSDALAAAEKALARARSG